MIGPGFPGKWSSGPRSRSQAPVDADERAAAIGIGRAVLAFGKARGVDAVAVLAGQIAAAIAAGLATGLTEGAARLPADANPERSTSPAGPGAIAVALAFARSRSFHALNAADTAGCNLDRIRNPRQSNR